MNLKNNQTITKNSGYLAVHYDLLKLDELSITDVFVISEIISLAIRNGCCYAGNSYFARRLGLGVRTVANSLAALKKLGLINIKNPGSKNRELVPDYRKLQSMLDLHSSDAKSAPDECKNECTTIPIFAHYNNIYKKNNKKNENYSAQNFHSSPKPDPHAPSYDIGELERIK